MDRKELLINFGVSFAAAFLAIGLYMFLLGTPQQAPAPQPMPPQMGGPMMPGQPMPGQMPQAQMQPKTGNFSMPNSARTQGRPPMPGARPPMPYPAPVKNK